MRGPTGTLPAPLVNLFAPLALVSALAAAGPALGQDRVLVVGDSHTATTFGRALDLLLRARPDTEVTTVGACGVRPQAFLEGKPTRCGYLKIDEAETTWTRRKVATPTLHTLLDDTAPDLVVIALGANELNTAWRNPEAATADARALIDQVKQSGARCLWVGPPVGHPNQKPLERIDNVYSTLAAATQDDCTLIDSRPGAMPFLDYREVAGKARRRGDGRHFDAIGVIGQQAARQWALEVYAQASAEMDAPATAQELADAVILSDDAASDGTFAALEQLEAPRTFVAAVTPPHL